LASQASPEASASPLVERVLDGFAERFDVAVETLTATDESMFFPLPRSLREAVAN
jgi:4-hydroxy-3-methylbut-2-en-1-yl diphosphate reductase